MEIFIDIRCKTGNWKCVSNVCLCDDKKLELIVSIIKEKIFYVLL